MSLQRQISNEETSIFEPRMKGLALSGLSTVLLNQDAIYIFGGGQSDVWRLNTSQINDEYSEQQYSTTTTNATTGLSNWMYTPPGIPWRKSNDTSSLFSQFLVVGTAQEQDMFLSIRLFDTISRSWLDMNDTDTDNTTSPQPLACQHHSAFSLDDQKRVLVYGGENSTHAMGHFWSFDIQTQVWSPLAIPPFAMRCGHSANLLDDGHRMVILGGFMCQKNQLLNINGAPRVLANMSSVLIYDTSVSQWSEQSTVGPYPQPRAYHTTVKSKIRWDSI